MSNLSMQRFEKNRTTAEMMHVVTRSWKHDLHQDEDPISLFVRRGDGRKTMKMCGGGYSTDDGFSVSFDATKSLGAASTDPDVSSSSGTLESGVCKTFV